MRAILAFGCLDESREIFTEEPRGGISHSRSMGGWRLYHLGSLGCAIWHIPRWGCSWSIDLALQQNFSYFILFVLSPNRKEAALFESFEMRYQWGDSRDRILRFEYLNRVALMAFISRPFLAFLRSNRSLSAILISHCPPNHETAYSTSELSHPPSLLFPSSSPSTCWLESFNLVVSFNIFMKKRYD